MLVVEPDAGARSLLHLGLMREGFQAAALPSAEEAERHLAEGLVVPGVVVAEVGLAGADGISLCQRLRAHPRLRDVPVLLLAARPTAADQERAGRAGADDYLAKPLFVQDLATLVRLRAGHAARDETLESHTDVLPLAAALRALLAGSSSGRLFLESHGQLLFRRGEVVSVRFEDVDGERGLTRMLALGRGTYRVHLGPVLARGELSTGLRELCGRLGAELILWERLVAVSVPLEAVLQPDFEVLRASLPGLPREAEMLLRLFDGTRTLRDGHPRVAAARGRGAAGRLTPVRDRGAVPRGPGPRGGEGALFARRLGGPGAGPRFRRRRRWRRHRSPSPWSPLQLRQGRCGRRPRRAPSGRRPLRPRRPRCTFARSHRSRRRRAPWRGCTSRRGRAGTRSSRRVGRMTSSRRDCVAAALG